MSPTTQNALAILERVITERNDSTGKGGQASVARELKCSGSLLTQVRKGDVPLSADLQERILASYSRETVACPELRSDIPYGDCAEHRRRPPTTDSYFAPQYRDCCINSCRKGSCKGVCLATLPVDINLYRPAVGKLVRYG